MFSIRSKMTKTKRSTPWNLPSFVTSTLTENYCSLWINTTATTWPSINCCKATPQFAADGKVKTSWEAYLKDGQNQQTMNKYIMSILMTRDTHTVQETRPMQPTHSACRKNANTTHQQTTAFFPGWPPDILQELPQNPPPSQVKRCQGWVPSESFKKFLLEVILYN